MSRRFGIELEYLTPMERILPIVESWAKEKGHPFHHGSSDRYWCVKMDYPHTEISSLPYESFTKFRGDIQDLLPKLAKGIGITKRTVNGSTGFHVHLELPDGLHAEERAGISGNLRSVQEFFFDLQPTSRRNSMWCRPLKECDWSAPDDRYHWVSFRTYAFRGTLEVRLAISTLNPEDIYNWVGLCRSLVDWALKSRRKQPRNFEEFLDLTQSTKEVQEWCLERRKRLRPRGHSGSN